MDLPIEERYITAIEGAHQNSVVVEVLEEWQKKKRNECVRNHHGEYEDRAHRPRKHARIETLN